MIKKLLYQFDTDPLPAVFDNVVAYDGGADQITAYGGVTAANVGGLVEGAIFTRGPKDKKNTALFIGGSSMAAGQALLGAVQARFFGKFRVSVMFDCNGSNTTAAAAVAWLAHGRTLRGKRAVVLAGTGPVGQRAAALLSSEGAAVAITGRKLDAVQAASAAIKTRFGFDVEPLAAATSEERAAAVDGARIGDHAVAGGPMADTSHLGAGGGCERHAAGRHRGSVDGRSRHREPREDLVRTPGVRSVEACIAPRLHRPVVRTERSRPRRGGDLCPRQDHGRKESAMTTAQNCTASITDDSIDDFLDGLASRDPTPGGGSAAAIMGAMGAALVSMVCNVSFGKKGCDSAEPELREVCAQSEALRVRLTGMVAQDVSAFDELMCAYKLPKDTDEQKGLRSQAIQSSLKRATEVPLACARDCAEVIRLSRRAGEHGYLGVISDAGVGVSAAYAAARSAALNVYINAPALKDRAFAERALAELDGIMTSCTAESEAVYALVRAKL
jgi:formiminotetrahydrofolate cyclodeaminase